MSKLIITMVGTSAISNKNKLYDEEKYGTQIDELKNYGTPLNEKIIIAAINDSAKIISNNLCNEKKSEFLPAEIASLWAFKKSKKLGISKDDVITLLSSETEDGKFCANVIKKVLDMQGWCHVIEPIVVKGFRTRKINDDENISDVFKNAGLNTLKDEIERLLKNPKFNFTQSYFNITGGFKAVIPFAAHIAFKKEMSLIYLYEDSSELIIISPPKSGSSDSYDDLLQRTTTIGLF